MQTFFLKADANGPAWPDKQIAKSFSVCENTVLAIRHRFAEQGLEAALNRKKQEGPSRAYKLDKEAETRPMCGAAIRWKAAGSEYQGAQNSD